MRTYETDILIAGGGTGGVAAALAALRLGRRVIVTEESDWIGGQLTAQAVPPDEHPWIESTGCTGSYRRFREGVRAFYRRNYPLLPRLREQIHLNPGGGYVSALCHEPRVAFAVLEAMLAPYQSTRQLTMLLRCRPISAETDGDRIRAVTFTDDETGENFVVSAPYVLDATELGDLLALAYVEHNIGSESQDQTGELHALPGPPQPLDQQAVTWCFALDYLPGEDHTIERPADYDFWRAYRAAFWPGQHLAWRDVHPITLEMRDMGIFANDPKTGRNFWNYRRIFSRNDYPDGFARSDITLVNWPQNDYFIGPLVGVLPDEKERHLRGAMQLSLSLLYWMQTEAPRHDGGLGYPGLRLRGDVTGARHGLAKQVYVRESRRIEAEFTVREEHIGVEQRGALIGAVQFDDSVGVGSYRIDLHPSTGQRNYVDVSSYPFQIPLGALLPARVENLLPACKNLGVTHITNGCYRLHPVEWNIGEAAGALAAYCLTHDLQPRQVRARRERLAEYQRMLVNDLDFVLAWPDYARITPR